MSTDPARTNVDHFRKLHVPGEPLLMPNAWDVASAACLAAVGFEAIGTSSAAVAATFGAPDGGVEPSRMYDTAAAIAGAVAAPVSADFENGYAASGDSVAGLVERSVAAGLAGISLEDWPRDRDEPAYELAEAVRRVRTAAETAAGRLVLTARADARMRDPNADLDEIIGRLVAYEEAGADVLFAPIITDPTELRRILAAITRPLSVMWLPGAPSPDELADLGVARVSLGPFPMYAAYAALAGLHDALTDDLEAYASTAGSGADLITRALGG